MKNEENLPTEKENKALEAYIKRIKLELLLANPEIDIENKKTI